MNKFLLLDDSAKDQEVEYQKQREQKLDDYIDRCIRASQKKVNDDKENW